MTQDSAVEVPEGLRKRTAEVRERIERAAGRAGRSPAGVEVLPVTKGHPPGVLRQVAAAGFDMLGENRVGEAEEKVEALGRLGVRWHMVGHLQRNKVPRAVRTFDVVESVDSVRLARELDGELEARGVEGLDVLVQVNTSGEASKFGFPADASAGQSEDEVREVCAFPRLRVRGLMTMAPLTDDEDVLRTTFRRARRAFERLGERVEGFAPEVLSMGMSNDFEIAVEEGSTRLRLGTALLGERPS